MYFISIHVLTTLKIVTWMAKRWPLCSKITSIKPKYTCWSFNNLCIKLTHGIRNTSNYCSSYLWSTEFHKFFGHQPSKLIILVYIFLLKLNNQTLQKYIGQKLFILFTQTFSETGLTAFTKETTSFSNLLRSSFPLLFINVCCNSEYITSEDVRRFKISSFPQKFCIIVDMQPN